MDLQQLQTFYMQFCYPLYADDDASEVDIKFLEKHQIIEGGVIMRIDLNCDLGEGLEITHSAEIIKSFH